VAWSASSVESKTLQLAEQFLGKEVMDVIWFQEQYFDTEIVQ
jgi:hypothetical protein